MAPVEYKVSVETLTAVQAAFEALPDATHPTLARHTGRSLSTIRTALAALREAGLIPQKSRERAPREKATKQLWISSSSMEAVRRVMANKPERFVNRFGALSIASMTKECGFGKSTIRNVIRHLIGTGELTNVFVHEDGKLKLKGTK
jgi:transposase